MEGILLTKLAYGELEIDEIKNAQIDDFKKNILLIAYYEKHNKKQGVEFIKSLKKSETDLKRLKCYNLLFERVSTTKKRLFDVYTYSTILETSIDFDLKIELLKEEKEVTPIVIINREVPEVKKEEVYEEQVIQEKKYDKKEVKKEKNKHICDITVPKTNNNVYKENNENIRIKNLFAREVLEISKLLYIQMNNTSESRAAAKAWDTFEVLIEKPISDKDALKRMLALVKKLSTNLDLEVDEKKYIKYL